MSRKNIVPSYKMIDTQPMLGDVTSSTTDCRNWDQSSVNVEWSAGSSPVGTITVQAKNGDNANWYTLDFNDTISISGNSGTHQIVFNQMPFTHFRIVYTHVSGDGTLNATVTSKTVGA